MARFRASCWWLVLVMLGSGCEARRLKERCEPRPAFAPWDDLARSDAVPGQGDSLDSGAAVSGLSDGLIAFYQRHMRHAHLPGQGCRLRPTCSVYGRLAVRKWGPIGLILTADRIFVREHPFMDARYVPTCAHDLLGDEGLHDPVP